jgi:Flp pilus assembly protein TadG
MTHRPRGQAGNAAIELLLVTLPLLLFVVVLMALGQLTATRGALSSVAREGARAAADARSASEAVTVGRQSAQAAAAGYGLDPARLQVTVDPAGFQRGGTLTVTATYQAPLDHLPSLGVLPGSFPLTARQLEPIDPHRSR